MRPPHRWRLPARAHDDRCRKGVALTRHLPTAITAVRPRSGNNDLHVGTRSQPGRTLPFPHLPLSPLLHLCNPLRMHRPRCLAQACETSSRRHPTRQGWRPTSATRTWSQRKSWVVAVTVTDHRARGQCQTRLRLRAGHRRAKPWTAWPPRPALPTRTPP